MPFLVGILSSNLSELNTYPMEEVVLLDLDSGKYLRDVPATADYKKILPDYGQNLKLELKTILKEGGGWKKESKFSFFFFCFYHYLLSKKGPRKVDLQIAQAFLNFSFLIFGHYESFIQNHVFDRQQFLQSRPADVRKVIFQYNLKKTKPLTIYIFFSLSLVFGVFHGNPNVRNVCERKRENVDGWHFRIMCLISNKVFKDKPQNSVKYCAFTLMLFIIMLQYCRENIAIETVNEKICCKCGIPVKELYVEKNNKLYCKDCYAKKKDKKQRIRFVH